jgi:hypothetical protein
MTTNELDAWDAAADEERAIRHAEEGPARPVVDHGHRPGHRVMWDHGRGVPGTVIPHEEWVGMGEPAPGTVCIVWDSGGRTLVDGSAVVPLTEPGPVPYTEAELAALRDVNGPPF